jgi:hypothetical protein
MVSAVMRELAARRWRGRVPTRLARELAERVDELPDPERVRLLNVLDLESARNLADLGRAAVRIVPRGWGGDSEAGKRSRWGGHEEGLRRTRGEAAGA